MRQPGGGPRFGLSAKSNSTCSQPARLRLSPPPLLGQPPSPFWRPEGREEEQSKEGSYFILPGAGGGQRRVDWRGEEERLE